MDKKTYESPLTKVVFISCESMLEGSEGRSGMFADRATGNYSSDANDRYDYEEDDEDLW